MPPDVFLTRDLDTRGRRRECFEGDAVSIGDQEQTRRSRSSSYLVRVWQETGDDEIVRFYLRDLKTGEERYVGDPRRIGDVLTHGLKTGERAAARRRQTA